MVNMCQVLRVYYGVIWKQINHYTNVKLLITGTYMHTEKKTIHANAHTLNHVKCNHIYTPLHFMKLLKLRLNDIKYCPERSSLIWVSCFLSHVHHYTWHYHGNQCSRLKGVTRIILREFFKNFQQKTSVTIPY